MDSKDIKAALLQITDFQQNHEFKDNYLTGVKIDLSNLWFIYSMNSPPDDSAIRDRLFCINVPGYGQKEKEKIIVNYLFPKFLKNIGKDGSDVIVTPEIANYIIKTIGDSSEGIFVH